MFKFFTQKQWFLWSIFGSFFILISTWYQVQLDVNSNFNSVKVSDELSHPINGFLVGLAVSNSNNHFPVLPNPDCIALLLGLNIFAFFIIAGRSGRIRTCDPLVPNQMRYQAALHSELRITNTVLIKHFKV